MLKSTALITLLFFNYLYLTGKQEIISISPPIQDDTLSDCTWDTPNRENLFGDLSLPAHLESNQSVEQLIVKKLSVPGKYKRHEEFIVEFKVSEIGKLSNFNMVFLDQQGNPEVFELIKQILIGEKWVPGELKGKKVNNWLSYQISWDDDLKVYCNERRVSISSTDVDLSNYEFWDEIYCNLENPAKLDGGKPFNAEIENLYKPDESTSKINRILFFDVLISKTGSVSHIYFTGSSSPPTARLAVKQKIIEIVRNMKFTPAKYQGKPVASLERVSFHHFPIDGQYKMNGYVVGPNMSNRKICEL